MLFCAPIIGMSVLVHGSIISCSAHWARPTKTTARRGSIFAAFLKLAPV